MRGPKPKPPAERFWPRVDKRDPHECWPWVGARRKPPDHYGIFMLTRTPLKTVPAHRMAYEFEYGPFDPQLIVMHTCDNPPCCNPAHLRLGTIGDNNRDRSNKGRGRENRQWAENNPNAKLREEDVKQIIAALRSGESQTSIAGRFGVKQPQISRIARREQWAYVWDLA